MRQYDFTKDSPLYSIAASRVTLADSIEWQLDRRRAVARRIAIGTIFVVGAWFMSHPLPVYAAEPSFTYQALNLPHKESSQAVVGDMDGDGDLDIVSNVGIVCLNDGTANCSSTRSFAGEGKVTVGDLDGDGDLDIVRNGGQIYLNDGTATFTASASFAGAALDLHRAI